MFNLLFILNWDDISPHTIRITYSREIWEGLLGGEHNGWSLPGPRGVCYWLGSRDCSNKGSGVGRKIGESRSWKMSRGDYSVGKTFLCEHWKLSSILRDLAKIKQTNKRPGHCGQHL